jgi:hypothetical protein
MMMTELNDRATQRSVDERLHTFKIAGQPVYMVRSRETEPGSMHQVHVHAGTVQHCTCRGWEFRQRCTHAAAVTRRLEREGRTHRGGSGTVLPPKTTADEPMDSAPTSKRQLFRSEA